MTDTSDPIPLELLQKLEERDILLLLVQAMNTQAKKMDSLDARFGDYLNVIDKKIGREEYERDQNKINDTLKEHSDRITHVAGILQDGDVKKKFFFGMTSNVWAVVVGCMMLINFFLMMAAIGSAGQ